MWRGISRAWSVGANEMGEMAAWKWYRGCIGGVWILALARLSGSILALGILEKFYTSVLSATFKL